MTEGEPTRASRSESILIVLASCASLAIYLLTNPAFQREAARVFENLRKLGERLAW